MLELGVWATLNDINGSGLLKNDWLDRTVEKVADQRQAADY